MLDAGQIIEISSYTIGVCFAGVIIGTALALMIATAVWFINFILEKFQYPNYTDEDDDISKYLILLDDDEFDEDDI
jgi:hypothetical protein